MAAASYTTDLATISTGDSGTFTESTATGWTQGAAPGSGDAENFIQGLAAVTKAFNATGVGTIMFNNAAGVTIPADGAFLAWFFWASPQTLDTEANGGIRLIIGSAQNAHYAWTMAGKDSYPYGGWVNYAADPAQTADYTAGAPSATRQWFGVAVNNLNAITKGNPMGMDVIRYGRCEARMNGGDLANGYATFSGYATTNDNTSNRWGLIQELNGAYQIKGLVIFGYTSAVDFRDSNKSIFIQNTKKVSANFNAFEVRQATSRVDLTSISFTALGTVSRGNWITTDNADVNITSCNFTDMGTFIFQSGATMISSTFRRCNLITQGGAVFTSCTFDSTNDSAKAIIVSNPANIASCTFVSSGTKHAIEFTTQGTYSWSANIFTGYAVSDGSTGNEAIYNNCTPYNTGQTYASSNQSATLSLRSDAGGTSATGESFAAGATKILSTARFYLKKTGTPTGNATAKIYAVTGSAGSYTPTGAALATSETFSVASLTGSYAMVEFLFKLSNCITLTSGTNYFVVLDVSATTSSAANTIDVGYDSTPAFATGNAATYAVTGSTWTNQTYDLVFDCYTDGAIILNLTNSGTTPTIRNAIGCSTSISASVAISVYVVDSSNTPLNDVQVAIFRTSDDVEIMNKDTGYDVAGNGYATTTYNGATPANIYLRVRKASTGTKYVPVSSTGTIQSSTGYSTTITLSVDPNA